MTHVCWCANPQCRVEGCQAQRGYRPQRVDPWRAPADVSSRPAVDLWSDTLLKELRRLNENLEQQAIQKAWEKERQPDGANGDPLPSGAVGRTVGGSVGHGVGGGEGFGHGVGGGGRWPGSRSTASGSGGGS